MILSLVILPLLPQSSGYLLNYSKNILDLNFLSIPSFTVISRLKFFKYFSNSEVPIVTYLFQYPFFDA